MTRWFRALVQSPQALGAALVCAAILGTPPAAHGQQVPKAIPTDADSLHRRLKLFDFDERPLGNFEDTPMYWTRFTGEGFPSYSQGLFDDEVGHDAPPAFRFDLRGGNIAYEYAHTDLVIFPDSDYLIEGWVRTRGLEFARAFVACYLVDRFGERIRGSEHISELVRSHPHNEGTWQPVRIALPGDFPTARALRLQLWALQRHVWWRPEEQLVDPLDIHRQDVNATVWFDDLSILRMPRVRFALTNPGGLIKPDAEEWIELDAHNATLAPAVAELTISDADGTEHYREAFDLAPQATRELRIRVPALPPGWYHARAELRAGDRALLERAQHFAVLPALPSVTTHEPDLGVDLGRWTASNEDGAAELIGALGCGAVRLGLPMMGTPESDADWEYVRQIRDLARRLSINQIRATAKILSPLVTDTPDARHTTWRMTLREEAWDQRAAPIFAYFGGYLLSWQLGDEEFELHGPQGWDHETVARVRQRLEQFVAAPELVVPWSVLDAPASGHLVGVDRRQLPGRSPPLPGGPLYAYSYWLPYSVPARLFPWHLGFWVEPGAPTGGGGPERWLTVGFEPDESLDHPQRVADLARRIVLAKAVNPVRLYVPAPFEIARSGGTVAWQPTDLYIPLRTLFHHLAGLRAEATLALEPDGVAVLFGDGRRHALVTWTWRADGTQDRADLYLGTSATALSLTGREVPLERDGARVRVPLTAEPLIIRDIDAPLLLLQDSIRLEPGFIQLHEPEPRPVLKLRNFHNAELSGTVDLQPPPSWQVNPTPIHVELRPDEEFARPLEFTIPPRQVASTQPLGVTIRLKQPYPIDMEVELSIQVLLRDVVVRATAWWQGDELIVHQTLHNLSDAAVSFNAFCQAIGRAQSEGVFLEVVPGDVRVQEYRFRAARDLVGSKLWMGIREIGGRRTLDQLVAVPE